MAMEDYWKSAHLEGGYELLNTPHMASVDLWKTSGHFDFYKEALTLTLTLTLTQTQP